MTSTNTTSENEILNFLRVRISEGKTHDTFASEITGINEELGSTRQVLSVLRKMEKKGMVKSHRFYPLCSNGCVLTWSIA